MGEQVKAMRNTTIQCINVSLLILILCVVLLKRRVLQGPSSSKKFSISVKGEFLIKE